MATEIIRLVDVTKIYGEGDATVRAVDGASLLVKEGDFVAVMGPSGSGKSTLMHILGCLDVPTSGEYRFAGEDVAGMNERELASIRNRRIGFVFQQFHLLSSHVRAGATSSCRCCIAAAHGRASRRRLNALAQVGLGDRVRAPTQPAVGRSAAARRDRAGAGHRLRR